MNLLDHENGLKIAFHQLKFIILANVQVKFNHALGQGISFGGAVLRHLWHVHITVTVGFVDQRLEVPYLNCLALVVRAVNHRVKTHWVLSIRRQQGLD